MMYIYTCIWSVSQSLAFIGLGMRLNWRFTCQFSSLQMAFCMHYPCTPAPCILHACTPSACSYGHLHASSTYAHLLPVPMDTSMHPPHTYLLPVPMDISMHHPHTYLLPASYAHLPATSSMQPVSQWQWRTFLSKFGWMGRVTSVLPRRELVMTLPDSWQLRLWNSTTTSWTAPHAVSREWS